MTRMTPSNGTDSARFSARSGMPHDLPEPFRELVFAGADWMWETDANHVITYVSTDSARVGLTPDDLVGRSRIDVVMSCRNSPVLEEHLRRLALRLPFHRDVFEISLPGHQARWVETTGWPVFDAGGVFRGYRGVSREVSRPVADDSAWIAAQGRIREVMETATDWVWETDRDHRFSYFSENFEERSGLPRDDLLGRSRLDLLSNFDGSVLDLKEHLADLADRRAFRRFTYPLHRADGETAWYASNGVPVFGPDGSFAGYRGTASNVTAEVTARLRAEAAERELRGLNQDLERRIAARSAALAGSNRLLSEVLDATNQGIVAFSDGADPGGLRVELINERASVLLGLGTGATPADLLWRRLGATDGPDAGTVPPSAEISGAPDFPHLRTAWSARPRGGFVVTISDVSDVREREAALQIEAARMEVFASVGSDWMWELGPDLRVTYLSAQVERVTGIPAASALGLTHEDVYRLNGGPEPDVSGTLDSPDWHAYRAQIAAREPVRDFRYWRFLADGSRRYISISAVPVFDPVTGDFAGYRGIGRDLTDLKRAEEGLEDALDEARRARSEAEAASALKSEFLASMSHEIRTPMNGVLGMAELLAQSDLTQAQRAMIDVIQRSGVALLSVINDVLDLSKIAAGYLELVEEPVALDEIVADILALLAAEAAKKGVRLDHHPDPNLPAGLVGDGGRVRQIVTNILGNAVKFTGSGSVSVRTSLVSSQAGMATVDIEVRDTGTGIAPENIERIFEPFRQAQGFRKSAASGTGLGLSICRRLVELMGGTISVQSEVGVGSVFTVRLSFALQPD